MITADEAQQFNLVNRVVAHEQLWAEAMAVAERIASGPLISYRYMKANINVSSTVDFRTMLDREAETHVRCGQTEDYQEGCGPLSRNDSQFFGDAINISMFGDDAGRWRCDMEVAREREDR